MMRALVSGLCLLGAAVIVAACGSGKEVTTSKCSASGRTFDPTKCSELGARNGCERSRVDGEGCAFEECDTVPSCADDFPATVDAGAKDAATSDAAPAAGCESALGNGFFSQVPPCADVNTTTINGNTRYACRCGSCACGYVCGSIPLEVGGTLGGVCAPP